jgi:hypothetical protein
MEKVLGGLPRPSDTQNFLHGSVLDAALRTSGRIDGEGPRRQRISRGGQMKLPTFAKPVVRRGSLRSAGGAAPSGTGDDQPLAHLPTLHVPHPTLAHSAIVNYHRGYNDFDERWELGFDCSLRGGTLGPCNQSQWASWSEMSPLIPYEGHMCCWPTWAVPPGMT